MTECLALPYRTQEAVLQALDRVRRLLPFPLLGLDTDNGGEFLNAELMAYCAGGDYLHARMGLQEERSMLRRAKERLDRAPIGRLRPRFRARGVGTTSPLRRVG